jgi:hypothetical protein
MYKFKTLYFFLFHITACSIPINDNSIRLENFLEKFLKNNFQVYENIEDNSIPIYSSEDEETEELEQQQQIDQQRYFENEEEDNKEEEEIDGIIELP